MQQLVKGIWIDAQQRLISRDQPLLGHLDRHAQRRLSSALATSCLQHVQLVLLDGEFQILHVCVMFFQLVTHRVKLSKNARHRLFHRFTVTSLTRGTGQWQRCADTGDDILALRIDQEFAIKAVFTCRWIAGEGNTRGTIGSHISENHCLHIDSRSPGRRNAVQTAIGNGPCVHPAVENCADSAPELNPWVLREVGFGLIQYNGLELIDKRLQIIAFKARVIEHPAVKLHRLKRVLKQAVINTHDNISIHLNEAAIAVIGKARIIGPRRKPGGCIVIQTEVENCIHHARH